MLVCVMLRSHAGSKEVKLFPQYSKSISFSKSKYIISIDLGRLDVEETAGPGECI